MPAERAEAKLADKTPDSPELLSRSPSAPAPEAAAPDQQLSPTTPAADFSSALNQARRHGTSPVAQRDFIRRIQGSYGNRYAQELITQLRGAEESAAAPSEQVETESAEPTNDPETPTPGAKTIPAAAEATAPQPTSSTSAPAAETAPQAAPAAPGAAMAGPQGPAEETETQAAATPAVAGPGAAAPGAPGSAEPGTDSDAAKVEEAEAPGAGEGAKEEAAKDGATGEAGAEAGAAAAGPKAPASPQEDPAFQAVVVKAKAVAGQQGHNNPAATKAAEAQASAVGPTNEVASKAAGAQVEKMGAQEPQSFDRAAFKAALLEKIAAITPKNLKEADEFKKSGKADSIKGAVTSKVAEGKEQSQGAIKGTTEEPPSTGGIEPKPVTPLPPTPPGPPPPDLAATRAAPKPKTASEVSLTAGSASLDQEMVDAEVTEEQLEQSNEPEFQGAVASKQEAQTDARERPVAYRQDEQVILAGAGMQATASAGQQTQAMYGSRQTHFNEVVGQQQTTRGEDEQRRAEVSNRIQEIYQATKEKVETRLDQLDQEVSRIFDSGAESAKQAFEDYVKRRMDDYKDRRYSGVIGKGRWVKDKLLGMPDAVNIFYKEGRDLYIERMDAVIDDVATAVESGLTEAKELIAVGRDEVQQFVDGLPEGLKEVGQQAAEDIQSRFDALAESVNNKQNELIDALARKYVDNLKQVDARIEEMKAANQGLVDKAIGAIKGVIETIIKLKNMLLNVIARAAAAIGKIIKDPIGFLGNLVSGIGQGLSNFMGRIGLHLKKGLMSWLFGALAEAGIKMPETFDLKGILSLVLQVLGLTYANIRARAVKIVGEPLVARLEQAAEIFKILITEGPIGLWHWIKGKLASLKETVMEGIMSFVQEKIIIAGITWIIGLLNPAAAFIKACKMIYDIVMFFVTRGSQILALVNAIIDSITAIAGGALSAAAAAVENALAKAIPVVIGFLASLLGLGGISGKIRSIIQKMQAPVNKMVDWVIGKAVKLAKAAGNLFKGQKKDEKEVEEDDPEKAAKVTAGLAAIDQAEQNYLEEGNISREDAEKVASTVKQQHPVFKSITVVDAGETWDYDYVASPGKKKKGERQRLKKHKSQFVKIEKGKYMLRSENRNKVFTRDQCYGKSYRTAVNDWKRQQLTTPRNKGGLRHPTEHNKYFYNGSYYENDGNTIASIDHQPMVVEHWENIGRKKGQGVRKAFFNGRSHLAIVPLSVNSEHGASAGLNYNYRVTKTFRGPGE